MNIIQFNEIIELLHSISDNSTANIIALVSVIISGIAVLSSIYFSVQTRKQYIDSLSPLLSFRLYEKSGYLFLRIENTGQSEATEISLTFKELSNNGEQNKFELDEILKSELTLYPNETVTGGICRSGRNIVTSIAPVIKIEVSYIKGNTKEKIQFFRCICFLHIRIAGMKIQRHFLGFLHHNILWKTLINGQGIFPVRNIFVCVKNRHLSKGMHPGIRPAGACHIGFLPKKIFYGFLKC